MPQAVHMLLVQKTLETMSTVCLGAEPTEFFSPPGLGRWTDEVVQSAKGGFHRLAPFHGFGLSKWKSPRGTSPGGV